MHPANPKTFARFEYLTWRGEQCAASEFLLRIFHSLEALHAVYTVDLGNPVGMFVAVDRHGTGLCQATKLRLAKWLL